MIRILFVCTGNTCRSPMAEGLLSSGLPDEMKEWIEVASAGIFASAESPATEFAVEVLEETGVDIKGHRSTQISGKLIDEADLIVAMTEAHASHILTAWPGVHEKLIVLGALDSTREDPDIRDPISGDREVYRDTRDELETLSSMLVGYIRERFTKSDK